MLQEAEIPTAVVNPRWIRDFAKLAKTDALDAEVLARFAEVIKPESRSLVGGDRMEFGDPRVLSTVNPGGKAGKDGVSSLHEEASCDLKRHRQGWKAMVLQPCFPLIRNTVALPHSRPLSSDMKWDILLYPAS